MGILGFTFNDYRSNDAERPKVVHRIKLKDEECRVFYDKLTYVYLEMPNFTKDIDHLTTRLDKWLYFINNLEEFHHLPELFRNDVVFSDVVKRAEIGNFNRDQLNAYEGSLKIFRDNYNVVESARNEGIRKWIEEGRREAIADKEHYAAERAHEVQKEMAAKCKLMGMNVDDITKLTGLTYAEISLL